jgi:hypothetical protein
MKKMGKLPMAEIGGALVGAVASKVVGNLIEKSLPNLSPTIRGGIIAAGGALLASQKSPLLKGAGLAMVSVGGAELAAAFLPAGLSGIDDIFVSAPADQSILSAPADQSILSGFEDGINEFIGEDYSMNGDDGMNGDDFSMNGDDGMNGDEYIGEDYQINGEFES